MAIRLPSRKTLALSIVGLIAAYLLLAWLALPRILQSQAEKFIEERTGHHLTMDRPEFNPFELSLRLSGLRLTQPDGAPLLAFRELVVDMSSTSIFRRAFVFDGIRLDGLEATVALLPNGQLNWSALIDSLKGKGETTSNAPLPRLDIRRFVLSDARLDFSDKRSTPAFATRIEPMNLELTDISTLPNDKGQYKVSAHTAFGARVEWRGQISLEPLAMTGSISVENADIAKLASYVEDGLPVTLSAGIAGMSTDYRLSYAGKLDLNLEHLAAKLSGLKLHGNRDSDPTIAVASIEAKDASFNLLKSSIALGAITVSGSRMDFRPGKDGAPKALQLGSISFENAHINLSSHQATLARIALKDGDIRITRNAAGHIDILEALQSIASSPKPKQTANNAAAGPPVKTDWNYRVGKLELASFGVVFRDESVRPSAEFDLDNIAIGLEGISENWNAAVPLQASFKLKSGGGFAAKGKVVPAIPSADIQIKLTGLNLAPAQPYLSTVTNLKLTSGKLATEGRASYSAKGANYQGSFDLRDLRLNEAESGDLFLALKSLSSPAFEVKPTKLEMDELAIIGLDTKLTIEKDKSVSIKRILRQAAADAETKPAAPQPVEQKVSAPTTAPASAFLVNIDRLRFSQGDLDFADYSLALPFATHIHDLHGVVTGISSRPAAPSQIELDGQVDDYGLARAAGQVEMFNPTNLMDIKVVFRNIEMYRLTPYSATFAGRKITSGKLSLDLEYKIHQRQLQGENQVIMDQLTLGEKVDTPGAMNLPLDLAIAILEDSDGRIDLGLPVSGNLDDPQFSYGGIVWKAIVNVLTKIVTAPFRALGALFGGNEKVDNIAFEAGDAQLTPPEREKLVKIAEVLNKRPGLSLALHGVYAEQDKPALQEKQLRHSVAEKIGQHVEGDSDPGPVSVHQPKVQAALESMYSEQFGKEELAALKDGFRQANPGRLEEGVGGRMMSKLSGLFRNKKPMSEQEVAQLKGGDFYAILADRLRNGMTIDDTRLKALATARGEAIAVIMKSSGAPMERIEVLATEKVDADGRDVPVKLELGAAHKLVKPITAPPAETNN